MKYFAFICILLCVSSCQAEDVKDDDINTIDGINIWNYPITDGSDSTDPLRTILMCKLLGFSYQWEDYTPFLQNPEDGPKSVVPNYTCSETEKNHLQSECLKHNNTHNSLVNLIDDKIEIALTARGLSRDEVAYANEKGVEIIEKPIAIDALTFIINHQNPINSLSIEQIQGIYTGQYTNWKELGGHDVIITPYVRNRNSGSQEKFETMVMNGLNIADVPELQIGTTMMSPYYQIEGDPTGISFTPFYYYSVIIGDGKTKGIGVNGVPMTKENISNGSYPLISNVYAVVRADIDKTSMAYKLFEFITTKSGQKIVEESGYVPLSKGNETSVRAVSCSPEAPYTRRKLYNLSGIRVENTLLNKLIICNGKKYLIRK